MELDPPGPWVRLDIVRAADELRIELRPGPGVERAAADAPDERIAVGDRTVVLPGEAIATIAWCARRIAVRSGWAGILPVFVAPRRGLRHLPWEQELGEVLAARAAAPNLQLVRLARPVGRRAVPAELPLRLLAVGPDARAAIDEPRRWRWLAHPDVRRHGLALFAAEERRLARALRELRPAIVAADERLVPAILRWGRGRPRGPHRGLQLVIALGGGGAGARRERAPEGVSIIAIDRARAAEAIAELVLGLVRDQPLHALVHGVRTRHDGSSGLEATPASVHALRIEPMARRIIDDQQVARAGLVRVRGLEPELARDLVGDDLRLDFRRETVGFMQLARARGQLAALAQPNALELLLRFAEARARTEAEAPVEAPPPVEVPKRTAVELRIPETGVGAGAGMPGVVPRSIPAPQSTPMPMPMPMPGPPIRHRALDEDLGDVLGPDADLHGSAPSRGGVGAGARAPHLERHAAPAGRPRAVDLQLERAGDHDALDPWLSPDTTLRAGARYRLCFAIGLALPGSLFVAAPPGIDAALPPPDDDRDRALEIGVYGLGLAVIGPPVRRLCLPARGPSRPLRFDLESPREGFHRARVIVYFDNQAVQSFLIEATVRGAETRSGARALAARLEFSRSPDLANLSSLRRRVACIAVNSGASPATHTFMVKGKGAAASSVNIPEAALAEQTRRLRQTLHAATFADDGAPRFPVTGATSPASPDFRRVVKELADHGRALYSMIAQRAADRAQLRAIRGSSGETVQIVRLDLGYAFPWSLLYDFPLPQAVTGGPPPDVCVDPACGHGIDAPAYCVRGFWGVRHVVEEILAQGERSDSEPVVPPGPGRGVALSLGLDDDFGRKIASEVSAFAGPLAAVASGKQALLDTLWDDARRPAQLILYSHLETRAIEGEPAGPRLVFEGDGSFLSPGDVSDRWQLPRAQHGGDLEPWAPPRPVVFLMACHSAAIEQSLLGGFAEVFHSAGALAIVGTEAPAFAALVSEFARTVARAWWSGAVTLGQAVTRFRTELLARGNPLGFVFTALGNSDLKLARGGTT